MKINTDKLKQIMKAKSMSTIDIAYKMQTSEAWVYAVLAGTHGRTFRTVEKFAEVLGVEPKELIE